MKLKWDNISHVLSHIMLSLFLLLCATVLYLGAFQDKEHLYALGLAVLAVCSFLCLCLQPPAGSADWGYADAGFY